MLLVQPNLAWSRLIVVFWMKAMNCEGGEGGEKSVSLNIEVCD